MKWTPRIRERVLIFCGKEKLKGIIIGQYDPELFDRCYWIQLDDGSLIDAHKTQLKKLKEKRTFFLCRFEGTTLSPEGFALPKLSLEAAKALGAKHELAEIVEVREIRKYRLEDIRRPDFLKPDISACEMDKSPLGSTQEKKPT